MTNSVGRGRRSVARITVACMGLLLALPASSALASVTSGTAPPLPPQPASPAAACRSPQPTPGAWVAAGDEFIRDGSVGAWTGSFGVGLPAMRQLTVEPSQPCVWLAAASEAPAERRVQSLTRSTDGGRSWRPVFRDDIRGTALPVDDPTCVAIGCVASSRQFHASGLLAQGQGQLVMSEAGNGDGLIVGEGDGSTWRLPGGGAGRVTRATVFGANRSQTGYSIQSALPAGDVTDPLTQPRLEQIMVTTDGGQGWLPTALPPSGGPLGRVDELLVDSGDANHVYALYQGSAAITLVEAGGSNVPATVLSTLQRVGAARTQLLVIRSSRHALRLVLSGAFSGYPSALIFSDDGGHNWRNGPAVKGSGIYMAAGSTLPDQVLVAATVNGAGGPELSVAGTRDGFDSMSTVNVPHDALAGAAAIGTPYDGGDLAVTHDAVLQPDDLGNFWLSEVRWCRDASTPGCTVGGGYRHLTWHVVPDLNVSGRPPPSCTGLCLLVPVPMAEIGHCPVPPTTDPSSGTVAFDGASLLYTQTGEITAQPYTGLVHRLDPRTCSPQSDLIVTFDPAFMDRHSTVGDTSQCHPPDNTFCDPSLHPHIGGLSFDGLADGLWLSVKLDFEQNDYLFLATYDFVEGQAPVARAVNRFAGGCGYLLATDVSTQTLWTCDAKGLPGHRKASDGTPLRTCFARFNTGIRIGFGSGEMIGLSNWIVQQPGVLLVQSEDDHIIYAYDEATCVAHAAYAHRVFAEATAEDEQMACDPTTFPGVTALWLRDASAQLMTAFAMPTTCSLATQTRMLTPTSIPAATPFDTCAATTFRGRPLPDGTLLQFGIDGQPVGGAAMVSGRACLPVGIPAGGPHLLTADFNGTRIYAGSHASAGLLTLAAVPAVPGPPPPAPPPVAAAPLPPPANAPNQPTTQGQPQTQPQPQPQAQVQAQAQGQTAMMSQEQEQRQLARQGAGDEAFGAMGPSSALELGAGAAMFAVAVIGLLRPRRSSAPARDARH